MINASQMKATSEKANESLQNLIKEICSKVEETAKEGRFKCYVTTDIYHDDVLDYVVHYFEDFGFSVSWELPRGEGQCHRVFTVRWY